MERRLRAGCPRRRTWSTDPGRSVLPVKALVGLALRRNPKRAHLLVSRVLAKHVPTEPGNRDVRPGRLLALLVRQGARGRSRSRRARVAGTRGRRIVRGRHRRGRGEACRPACLGSRRTTRWTGAPTRTRCRRRHRRGSAGCPPSPGLCELLEGQQTALPGAVTIGYAETATGLGQLVAGQLGTYYIHSTRQQRRDGVAAYGAFEEAHSHATSHQLLPTSRAALDLADTVILVDDELSTGATIINTIRELHRTAPHRRYVIASLVDLRSAADREALSPGTRTRRQDQHRGTGERQHPAAGNAGRGRRGPDRQHPAGARPPAARAGTASGPAGPCTGHRAAAGQRPVLDLTGVVPIRSARFGIAGGLIRSRRPVSPPPSRIHSLRRRRRGTGCWCWPPRNSWRCRWPSLPGCRTCALTLDVRYSTSTRSPIAALDEPDYAIRSAVAFERRRRRSDGPGPRFAYNFTHPDGRFDTVVVMAEPGTPPSELTAPGKIAEAVAGSAADVRLVLLPRQAPFPAPLAGPAFGSYRPRTSVAAQGPEFRAAGGAAGRARSRHPVRQGQLRRIAAAGVRALPRVPGACSRRRWTSSAARIAHAVGMVTEQVLKLRDNAPVLVSLARAGTPVGILMKRWAREVHGLDLPHYAVSIVRGLGIDQTALGYLAARHDPDRIMFVDGWTGKGAIARELADAVGLFEQTDGAAFRPDLAVLADPGHCVRIFGTREDYLVPSACLNSTVSGLVSRTVFNKELIRPGDFHGAKFYSDLAGSDVSGQFLDAVTAQFPGVRDGVLAAAQDFPAHSDALPGADWSGWAAVEEISRSSASTT